MAKRTATVIRHIEYPTGGRRRVYELSKPAQSFVATMLGETRRRRVPTHIAADFEPVLGKVADTIVFCCNERGLPTFRGELWCGDGDWVKDDAAIEEIGITVLGERS